MAKKELTNRSHKTGGFFYIFIRILIQNSLEDFLCSSFHNIYITSGFWPRVRARALRAPVFLGTLPGQTGRCAPPAHRSFAASYSYPKNKNNLPNSGRRVKGYILSTLPPRPESIQSDRLSIQSSELGPPPPHRKRVFLPHWDPRGETHLLSEEGVGGGGEPIPMMGHTLWYSRYTIISRRPML